MRFTAWYVITGAPCSGKTTVILELERMGFQVVHEAARAFIDEEIAKGRDLSEIKADGLAFERTVLERKRASEVGLETEKKVFLDRGAPDSIAYYKMNGFDPDEAINACRETNYKKIFMMERFEYEKDRARSEDGERAQVLDRLIEESYRMFAYDIVRVPVLPVRDRVYHILENM